jgi:hypothetical protein
MRLARFGKVADTALADTIIRLSADPRPEVRFQVATGANAMYALDPTLAWQLFEERSVAEPNVQVAARLVQSLYRMRGTDHDRAATVARTLYHRFVEHEHSEHLRNSCMDIWASMFVLLDHQLSRSIIDEFTRDVPRYHAEIIHMSVNLRNVLKDSPIDPPDPVADECRKRGVELIFQFACAARAVIDEALAAASTAPSKSERQRIDNALKTAEQIGMQIYFASGALHEKQGIASDGEANVHYQSKVRFYKELDPVIDELVEIGLSRVAYHFVEMYGSYADIDPRSIFLKLERTVIVAATRDGLAFEGMAVDVVVKIVSRYLADYRDLLRTDDACRAALISILDTFVMAGWPQAWQLTYKLGDIDR